MKTQKRHDIIIVQLMSKLNVGRKKCPCIEVHKLDGVNDMNGKNKNNNPSEMIIYTTEDGLAKIETTFDGDTVWLSIDQMAELFQRDRSVIGKHVRNIFKEGRCMVGQITCATVGQFLDIYLLETEFANHAR